MYLVALTRWESSRALDAELPWLAPLMGVLPYEARLRLNAGSPVVLVRGLALADAQQTLSALRTHGHGAVAIDETAAPQSERALVAAGFELLPDQLIARARDGQRYALPFPQLIAVVRAIEVCEEERAHETVEKKLALGRALLSGGLMRNKTVRTEHTAKSLQHEQVAYLFRREGAEPLLLRQSSLHYEGLGSLRGTSAVESFARLLAVLRERAPHALHDDRLCARKRRTELTAVSGTAREQTRSSTNATANALAAYILVHAHLQAQL
jgi:hypothetical protein